MKPAMKFLALLAMLAKQCGETFDDFRGEFYLSKLQDLGLDRVNEALEKLLESARRFPTIAEIKQQMGIGTLDNRGAAQMIADRILNGIHRYGVPCGAAGTLGVKLAIGPSAWFVVEKQGGWEAVIDRAGEGEGMILAQLRDAAKSYIDAGLIDREAKDTIQELPDVHAAILLGRRAMEQPSLPPAGRMAEVEAILASHLESRH